MKTIQINAREIAHNTNHGRAASFAVKLNKELLESLELNGWQGEPLPVKQTNIDFTISEVHQKSLVPDGELVIKGRDSKLTPATFSGTPKFEAVDFNRRLAHAQLLNMVIKIAIMETEEEIAGAEALAKASNSLRTLGVENLKPVDYYYLTKNELQRNPAMTETELRKALGFGRTVGQKWHGLVKKAVKFPSLAKQLESAEFDLGIIPNGFGSKCNNATTVGEVQKLLGEAIEAKAAGKAKALAGSKLVAIGSAFRPLVEALFVAIKTGDETRAVAFATELSLNCGESHEEAEEYLLARKAEAEAKKADSQAVAE